MPGTPGDVTANPPDGTVAEPLSALVERLRAVPPPMAVLAGAGTSSSSGIATGEDLLGQAARERGEDPYTDPVGWYVRTFGAFPNYIRMLQEAAGPNGDPHALPSGFFEAGPAGPTGPGPAHRAIAAMAAAGLVGPVLTTNFDRLLEQALVEAGVAVQVAYGVDEMARATREPGYLARPGILLVKLHGDYTDIRIRDTSAAFHWYHPTLDALLDRVLAERDLLVCGWSASWDTSLRRALLRVADPERRRTFWLLRGTATPDAAEVIAARRALIIPVASSNDGLTRLVRALGLSPADQTEQPGRSQPR